MSDRGAVLGWDVGWSTTRQSGGICVLNWQNQKLSLKVRRCTARPDEQEDALSGITSGLELHCAAFDGPLRRDLHHKAPFEANYRACERFLTRDFQPRIGKPGQSSSPNGKLLHEAATKAARMVDGLVRTAQHKARIHKSSIVEAFPTSFLGVMLDTPPVKQKNKARSDQFYLELCKIQKLEALTEWLLPGCDIEFNFSDFRNHDERAAIVCALTALCVDRRKYSAIGDPDDGYIILPPLQFWSRWALLLLNKNIQMGYRSDILIEEF